MSHRKRNRIQTGAAAERVAQDPLVTFVIDPSTGDPADAVALLRTAEGGPIMLRTVVEERRIRGDEPYRCVVCRQPLGIRGGGPNERRGLFWSHLGHGGTCPLSDLGRGLGAEDLRAAMYMGRQESRAHKLRKAWLGRSLAVDPRAGTPEFERVVTVWKQRDGEEAVDREWRKPDVRVVYDFGTPDAPRQRELVFEIQLSNTFLTDIVGRRQFHWDRGVPLIWVMDRFDQNASLSKHDCFVPNGHNGFIVDEETLAASEASGRCMLRAVWALDGRWESALVPLADLQIDFARRRVLHVDVEAIARERAEAAACARLAAEGRRLRAEAERGGYTDFFEHRRKFIRAIDALIDPVGTSMGGFGYRTLVELGHHLASNAAWRDLAMAFVVVADLAGLTPSLEAQDPTGRWRTKAESLRAEVAGNLHVYDLVKVAERLYPENVRPALQRARAARAAAARSPAAW